MGSGLFNTSKPAAAVINGTDYHALVDFPEIAVQVNKWVSALVNHNPLNYTAINGMIADGVVSVRQVHAASINNAAVSVEAKALTHIMAPLNAYPVNYRLVNGNIVETEAAIAPETIYLAVPRNAVVVVTCPKVMVRKGAGGHLFVTVVADAETCRFSFEGVKA